jgi:hypothetical protein
LQVTVRKYREVPNELYWNTQLFQLIIFISYWLLCSLIVSSPQSQLIIFISYWLCSLIVSSPQSSQYNDWNI